MSSRVAAVYCASNTASAPSQPRLVAELFRTMSTSANSWSDGPRQGYHVANGALSSGAEEARAIISSGITPAALLAPATWTGSETEQD